MLLLEALDPHLADLLDSGEEPTVDGEPFNPIPLRALTHTSTQRHVRAPGDDDRPDTYSDQGCWESADHVLGA